MFINETSRKIVEKKGRKKRILLDVKGRTFMKFRIIEFYKVILRCVYPPNAEKHIQPAMDIGT